MDNKILLYVGIAGIAYYLYIKSKDFKFTDAEKAAITSYAKGDPILFIKAFKIVLTPSRYAKFIEWSTKNQNKIPKW